MAKPGYEVMAESGSLLTSRSLQITELGTGTRVSTGEATAAGPLLDTSAGRQAGAGAQGGLPWLTPANEQGWGPSLLKLGGREGLGKWSMGH